MIDFRNTVIDAASKQLASAAGWLWLIEVRIPEPSPTRFRITNFSEAVQRGTDSAGHAITYYPFPVAFGDLSQQVKGNLSEITVNVANCNLEMASLIDQYEGLVGQPFVLKFVHSQGLSDLNAELRTDGTVTRAHVTNTVAVFTISATNLTKTNFPKNRMEGSSCGRRFGDSGCGYVLLPVATNIVGGGFDFCPRELEACEERGRDESARGVDVLHPLRFDAFPGMRLGSQ